MKEDVLLLVLGDTTTDLISGQFGTRVDNTSILASNMVPLDQTVLLSNYPRVNMQSREF